MEKLKPNTIFIDLDLEPNIWVKGDEKSVVFNRVYDGTEKDNFIELTWEEISELAFEELERIKNGKI